MNKSSLKFFNIINIWNSPYIPVQLKNIFLIIHKLWKRIVLYHRLKKLNPFYYKYNLGRKFGPQKKLCYAPDKSMYFGRDGNVTACCLNRSHVFGDIKNQRIEEIWHSDKINELRQSLQKDDMSKGCDFCKQKIENENFDAIDSFFYDLIPYRNKFPSMLEFELSNDCNLECIMCNSEFSSSISRKEHGKNIHNCLYGDEFLKQLDKFIPHLVNAKFLGGEPFLIPVYYKIWERIIQLNQKCNIIVQTNASILNQKIINLLNQGNFRICISIDSFKRETYEKIRKNADFDIVMNNINYFSNYANRCNYELCISVCPMQQNWTEIPEIILKANELGANVYFNTVWAPKNCSLNTLNHNELLKIINVLSVYTFPKKTSIEKKNYIHFQSFIIQLKSWEKENKINFNQKETIRLLWLQNKLEIEKISVEELCTMIFDNIKKEKGPLTTEEIERHNFCYSKLLQVAHKFECYNNIKNLLYNTMQMSGEDLLTEIECHEIDYIFKRVSNMLNELDDEE